MNAHQEENIWQINSTIRLKFSNSLIARIVWQAVYPEIATQLGRRARAALEHKNDYVVLKIAAKDHTALRATMNSFLRWISGIVSALDLVEPSQPLESSINSGFHQP